MRQTVFKSVFIDQISAQVRLPHFQVKGGGHAGDSPAEQVAPMLFKNARPCPRSSFPSHDGGEPFTGRVVGRQRAQNVYDSRFHIDTF